MNTTHEHTKNQAGPTRSIDFWVRAVDALANQEIERSFRSEGLTRRDLRILTMIAKLNAPVPVPVNTGDEDANTAALVNDLHTERIRERIARGGKRIAALEWRGWIRRISVESGVGYELTEDGKLAHKRLAGIAEGVATRIAGSVSSENLSVTIAALETMARELGWEEGVRLPKPERERGGHRGRSHRGNRGHRRHRHPGQHPAAKPELQPADAHRGHKHWRGGSGHHDQHRGHKHWRHGYAAGFAAAREG